MSIVFAFDAIGVNIGHLPKGQACGYTTGTGIVPWTASDWAAHPGAVRICQDAGATDTTADVLDVERGAATVADCPRWFDAALANFKRAARPGQRLPAIYTSMANVTAVANGFIAGGVRSGPRLWIADWNGAIAADENAINTAGGPWPIIGYQFRSGLFYDYDVFSGAWLADVSAHPKPPPPPPTPWQVTAENNLIAASAELLSVANLIKTNVK